VTGEAAIPFKDDLVAKLQWAVDICERERAAWGCRAMQRVEQHYSWNAVTDAYEALFRRLMA
jgi:glycosyltransferase involved in cell wall biosynthesis